jgi:hypothetical protein
MGWQDRLNNIIFTIRTGDGKIFQPDWKSGETSKDFNATVFDFIGQPGSLIDRKKVKARRFPLTFWFQGDDNIDQAEAFDKSANDPRAWIVNHPFYGQITGQPLSVSRNDTLYNATEITVDFYETIITQFPVQKLAVTEGFSMRVDKFHTISPIDYASKVKPKPIDKSIITDNADQINAIITKALNVSNYTQYQTDKAQMFTAIDNIILAPAPAIYAIQQVMLDPANFNFSIQYRARLVRAMYDDAVQLVTGKPTPNNKYYYEATGSTTIAAMAQAMITPIDGDYVTRTDVVNASSDLLALYNEYLVMLDSLYVADANPSKSFSQSAQTQDALQELVIYTLAGLNEIAFNAKQERLIILDRDSQLIVLTHKYMGLDPDDANIETFRSINGIKNTGVFLVKKGTQIKYYA